MFGSEVDGGMAPVASAAEFSSEGGGGGVCSVVLRLPLRMILAKSVMNIL